MKFEKVVEDTVVELLRRAVVHLPKDIENALVKASIEEESEAGRVQLKAILDNVRLAREFGAPMCQDTGLLVFFLKVGDRLGSVSGLSNALVQATKRATLEVPLRPNAVHPITRKNSADNTGPSIPCLDWDFIPGDFLEVAVLPKGAGSENMSSVGMLNPGDGLPSLKKFVVDTVITAGGRPCPPIIVGVGIGGTADGALKLGKKALLRPIDKRHPDPDIAKLETDLVEALNMTGIGPMGLGGKFTALGVNVEYAYCHTASLPVGVNIQCWADRRAAARIHLDGRVEYLLGE
jgi:fumarate hydratase subunit alpha